ncbi:hypothetical protein PHISCL_07791 [Aspergillus sclerotialis]|uniref:Kinetochore protein Sos7 coiled-coil domain-containing protein n=1 Tax=Aspergillus sclerotialis TaxID=2070753 RepID=A0A3A2ZKI4_9EURO|nr:hypothetical protein PHISCL_07791 [Aspergillus sclerotialis]
MVDETAKTLEKLRAVQRDTGHLKDQLSIIRISEPITSVTENTSTSPSKRNSDISTLENPTPATLEADLTHYKELFSKLRFSYVEQVTKEKFLRAIVGDPPLVVGHNENVEMEKKLAEGKAELKERKEEVRGLIEEMNVMSRDLASRYKEVELHITQITTLPASIENLESTIAGLKAKQVAGMESGSRKGQNLPLADTLALVGEREAELASLNRQIAAVQNTLPRKAREAEAVERELMVLERRKDEAIVQARLAEKRKSEGKSDGLEEMGRWYRGSEQTLRRLLVKTEA